MPMDGRPEGEMGGPMGAMGTPNGGGNFQEQHMVEEVLDYRTYCETMAGLLLNLLLGYC